MKTYINTNQLGEVGRFGEDAAAQYLLDLGYELVARNAVYAGKEIDIIAEDMRHIVFVEVKTRKKYHGISRYNSALRSVDHVKQQSIISAAKAFLKVNRKKRVPRFDVIEVSIEHVDGELIVSNINHIPRAFGTW